MKLVVLMPLVFTLIFIGVGCAHHSHNAHHEHHQGEAKLELNDGKKWETDESLRKGMTEIKKIVTSNLSKVSKGTAEAKTFTDIATQVDSQIQFLIKNCKLSEDADAQLHTLIAQMVGAVHQMKDSPDASEKKAGFLKVVEAVNSYGDYFDHPKWTKVEVK